MIPLLFMGDEWGSKQPFLFFTDHHDELAKAVCEGRRNEFKDFSIFADEEVRERIPDPNALSTFTSSMLDHPAHEQPEHQEWWNFYRELLQIRHAEITPRLNNAQSAGVEVLAEGAVLASWTMGDGSLLRIYLNLSKDAANAGTHWQEARILFKYRVEASDLETGNLPADSIVVTTQETV